MGFRLPRVANHPELTYTCPLCKLSYATMVSWDQTKESEMQRLVKTGDKKFQALNRKETPLQTPLYYYGNRSINKAGMLKAFIM